MDMNKGFAEGMGGGSGFRAVKEFGRGKCGDLAEKNQVRTRPLFIRSPRSDNGSNLKVCFFGHSYIKYLWFESRKTRMTIPEGVTFDIDYVGLPGATFKTFLDNPDYLTELERLRPDYLFVILGGNDLKSGMDVQDLYNDCKRMYGLLREKLPQSFIIAAEIENRFNLPGNRHNAPTGDEFASLRRRFNRFLCRLKSKDCVLRVQAPNQMEEERYYTDGVHLNSEGLYKYLNLIRHTLSYAYDMKSKIKC